ncbi:MAG TPA: autotransporter-associated beta strand repeat-containing protein, partial [Bradyrhizobium sp.]
MASAALPTTLAHAGDATWNPGAVAPANADFNTGDNWAGTPDKTVPTLGTATFNASNTQDVTITGTTNLGGMTLKSRAGTYTFTNTAGSTSPGLTFIGAGIIVEDGAAAKIDNVSSNLNFAGTSSAGLATISNDDGSTIIFRGSSKAGHATITNLSGGKLLFSGDSAQAPVSAQTATIINFSSSADSSGAEGFKFDNGSVAAAATIYNHGDLHFVGNSRANVALIQSDTGGTIFIEEHAKGDTARIVLGDGLTKGNLDISRLATLGTTVGSLAGSGNVFLGSKNLDVFGFDQDTVFSGVIQDGTAAPLLGGGGSLTKGGTGALTLTGINTYTGTTTVSGGALIVDGDGSIASSSVIVNAGGTLAGTGTVGSTISTTTINAGGTLAPGHGPGDGTFGKLTVQGNLSFAAAATYLIQVSPTAASNTSVTGTASLNGATVKANFASGTYVKNEYTILTAGTVDGQFNPLVTT